MPKNNKAKKKVRGTTEQVRGTTEQINAKKKVRGTTEQINAKKKVLIEKLSTRIISDVGRIEKASRKLNDKDKGLLIDAMVSITSSIQHTIENMSLKEKTKSVLSIFQK
jgi:hypothetical protein